MQNTNSSKKPKVVIIGAGFGGPWVETISYDYLILANGSVTSTFVVPGVKGEKLAAVSNIPVRSDGRVSVKETLQIPEQKNIYAIGDLAAINEGRRILPMVAQVAIQSGVTSARNILRQIAGLGKSPLQLD